jgi:hypothetical protein
MTEEEFVEAVIDILAEAYDRGEDSSTLDEIGATITEVMDEV